jgi:hypothetical protein
MPDEPLHPRLIQANRALFEGDRIEARRLLEEYRRTSAAPADLLAWLDANTESDAAARLEKLRHLAEHGSEPSIYVRMAREYVGQEDALARRLHSGTASRWRRRMFIPLALMAALIVAGGVLLARPGREIDALLATATATLPPATVTPYPDTSVALSGADYSVRYSAGILTVQALEDRSERVVSLQTGQQVLPVPGARFFALELTFECRTSICRQPPQANVLLRLDTGDLIEARADVVIADQDRLQAIALGRATRGWVVYEIPVLNRAEGLQIAPFSADASTEIPLMMALPVQ